MQDSRNYQSEEVAEKEGEREEWVPPQGQLGDGKTSLNSKYGY